MFITRQDHIDWQVAAVHPCRAHHQRGGETMVAFVNDEWACSSGHVSNEGDLPCLRASDRDPVAWIKTHADELIRAGFPLKVCLMHADGGEDEAWGLDGHLWKNGPHGGALTLCLPRA